MVSGGDRKGKKGPFFLGRTPKVHSGSFEASDRTHGGDRSGDSGASRYENSDSDLDEGADGLAPTNAIDPGIPSFARRQGRSGQHDKLIEEDAMRTIRDTSGMYDEEELASSGDEEMDHKYREKMARLARNGSSSSSHSLDSRAGKNVRFQNSAVEYDDEKSKASSQSRGERDRNGDRDEDDGCYDEVDDNESLETTESGKFDHFKKFFHRSASQAHRESGHHEMRSLKGDDDEDDNGFLSKLVNNMSQSAGLAPGFPTDTNGASNNDDLERVGGQGDIPMTEFNDEAQQIVQQHSVLNPKQRNERNADSNHLEPDMHTDRSSEGDTMREDSSFVAPPMESYAFNMGSDGEETDDYDPFIENTAYVAPPARVRGGVLGSLLKLYQNEDPNLTQSQLSLDDSSKGFSDSGDGFYSEATTPRSSRLKLPQGAANLKKLKNIPKNIPKSLHSRNKSASKLDELDGSGKTDASLPTFKNTRPKGKKARIPKFKKRMAAEAKITVHIADLLQRHRFVLRMCKALMLYGAPTHRLEEYMVMTSRVLEIDGQFLYIPGCMIVSFGDATTRTSEVQLVRVAQGLNLWKLHQVHSVYKKVIHDTMSAAEGNLLIDKILQDKNLYSPWICVFLYGFCSAMVTPFAFGGDWINLAISFFMGSCVGCLQYIVSQRSNMYSNVFEVSASIVVSFCGRAFGTIHHSKICFGAVTQGSLALILPGYIILCGSLELQSRNLVAGSVRMFYAIIYSLFLGFGITLGAALFGWMCAEASNDASCNTGLISPLYRILFVPAFTVGISLINQASWRQLPVMVVISCTGYVVTYYAGKHFQNSTEFTAALAAFVIGLMGNLYSRIWQGLAVSAMLPAIFVQVPSGVASQSSLLAGIQSANELTNHGNSTGGTADLSSSMAFGVTMVQVSIGITVGLFASSLFIYPFGKKKTGLFSL